MTRIEIRDRRLRGGRMALETKTASVVEARRREAAVRTLLDQGEHALIEGIRGRQLHIADVARAVALKEPARERALRELRFRVTGEAGPTLQQGVDRAMAIPRRPRTQRFYKSVSDSLLGHFTPDRPMADILTTEAQSYLTQPQPTNGNRPWGASRQNMARAFGAQVWKLAIADEDERALKLGRAPVLTRNIWQTTKTAGDGGARVEFLRPEEWLALRERVRGLPQAALLALGCRAGLRAQEAAYLRTGLDVDLERRVIHVRGRGGDHPWQPKSKHGTRDVPVPDDLLEILADHERTYAGRTFFLHAPGVDRPMSHTLLIRWTRESFEAVGIRYGRKKDALTYHSLRHTYASWLTQAGMHPKKVARLIGDTPEMVLRIYGHLAEDDHDEAVGLLNEAVRV